MEIREKKDNRTHAVKLEALEDEAIIGRAYLYLIYNDLHEEPYGLLEDVFVDEAHRGKGIGSELVKYVIEEAKKQGCYKLIATSRFEREDVHEWYKRLGFTEYGKEFRLNFE